jgi:hypothetical protein
MSTAAAGGFGFALFGISAVMRDLGGAGVGFSLPYPLFYDEGERVLPDRPLAGLGLLQVGSNAFPIVAIPLIGEALSDGRQELAFVSLAGLVAVTALASLGPGPAAPAAEPVNPPSARPG